MNGKYRPNHPANPASFILFHCKPEALKKKPVVPGDSTKTNFHATRADSWSAACVHIHPLFIVVKDAATYQHKLLRCYP